ncbi:caspase family protein [Actinokineospora terrae]|uniref:Caspase domain-containing protein n=1 Tax=Actinokineospora terrae TaxID=155974 RepID=A0A1H9XP33_9PSEU|nr:caspase family protein [Actinokineospora terrae]SES47423.1 Caspase domain-containing protein [Actinokineospora terrae]
MAERTYRALLVTNGAFPDDPGGLAPLLGPARDAELMRSALTDPRTGLHLPADVRVVADADQRGVLVALDEFFDGAARDDQLLLYYSGHGKLDAHGNLHLAARDTRADRIMSTGVAARAVVEMMAASRARAKVVLLDCCHSGGFKSAPDLPRHLGGRGVFVLASSLSVQLTRDAEQPGEPSPFTRYAAECLAAGHPATGGYVTVDDLYRHIADRMADARLSTPQRRFDDAVDTVALARTPTAGTDHALSPEAALTVAERVIAEAPDARAAIRAVSAHLDTAAADPALAEKVMLTYCLLYEAADEPEIAQAYLRKAEALRASPSA